MLNKRIINTGGGVACTTDTTQILDAGTTTSVATYRFEDNANDVTTNNNGTANNITYSTGKFGKAAVFNGSSTGIEIPNLSTMFGQKTSYTVSAWFKAPSSATGNRAIFDDYNYANSNLGLYLYDGVMNFFARYNNSNTSGIYSGTVTYNDNNWHHVVATSDQTTGKLYIDGQLISSGAMPSPSYSGGSPVVSIGKQQHPGSSTYSWFDGSIDQVRIFDHAITAAQVTALYNETATTAALATIDNPSTIAYYKMEDATDETGSYDGTATNVNFNVEGKYGFAGLFNGSNSYIDISTLDFPTNNFSVSAWVYLNSTPGSTTYNMILTTAKQNSGGYFYFTFYGTQLQYYHVASGTSVIGGTVVAGQWNHVVLTQSSTGGAKVYLNASVAASNTGLTANNTPNTTSGGVNTLGFYNTGSSTTGSLNGRMDQVRIFNKAISAAEVTTLYNEIQCANTITAPENYFNTKLYTGDGNSSKSITGVGFQPDWTWIKNRSSNGENHNVWDSVRGNGYTLYPNLSDAQNTGNLLTLNTDGFTLNTVNNNINTHNYVSWNWKAASSNTTNNDGTITSTVRASQESGFSIATYTGNGSAGATVGHGLNKIPSMVITKGTTGSAGATNWNVYTSATGPTKKLVLNSNAAEATNTTYWNNTAPTASVFSLGTTGDSNYNGSNYVAYCFANIDGYQRIGSYVGNATNTRIYTGFEPAWLLVKSLSSTNTWWIVDNKRDTTNPRTQVLKPNSSSAETTETTNVIFHTNGFEFPNGNSDTNENNYTYLFWAIAANPDTTAPTKANSFKTVLYTGNGGTQSITGAGFKPDLAWIKRRSNSEDHVWFDTMRGPQLQMRSNATASESTKTNALSSFDSDGFTTGANNALNTNNETYVSWLWKALDHDRNLPAINNNGQITSSVSANPAAGFSIVQYVSDGASSISTKGHGLGAAPEMFIVYSRTHGSIWQVYHKDLPLNQYIFLNGDNALSNAGATYYSSSANTIGFRDGSSSGSGQNMIAYCWHSVSGYSKIGSYSGSGSSGKSITTGFQPSFVLIKNSTSQAWWNLSDSVRGASKSLFPNDSYQEVDDTGGQRAKTFNSTGFTLDGNNNDINGSGQTYIYMAIK